MTIYYRSTDFKFSTEAINYLQKYYRHKFKKSFFHAEDIDEEIPLTRKNMWINSIIGKELKNFLSRFNCDLNFHGITFFLCNSQETFLGNPHIDSLVDSQKNNNNMYSQSESSLVKSRFSVMIYGNPQDHMTWWNHMKSNDSRLIYRSYKYLNQTPYEARGIPGDTMEDRWKYLGDPTCVANNFWKPSAFIKTDCAHTITCSPGPRLMVTVPFNKTLEEIFP